jgi:plastocyanin
MAAALFAFKLNAEAATTPVTTGTGTNNQRFAPNIITIHAGDTVTFNLGSGAHNVDLEDVTPDLPINATTPTGTTNAFNTPGTYFFYCSIHADEASATEAHVQANDAMVGKIVVLAAGTTPSATATTPAATATTPAATATSTPTNGVCNLTVADQVLPSGSKQLVVTKGQQGQAGYIAIHESSASGGPGPVIGFTSYEPAGSVNTNVTINLDRPFKDGETVWAMLHTENNGNTTYDGAAVDLPTVDANCGNPKTANIVTFPFKLTAAAAPPGAPGTGSGVAPTSDDNMPLIVLLGAVALAVVGGGGFVAGRRVGHNS